MSQSLFEPKGSNALGDAAQWLSGTLLGSLAVGLCVLAVAFTGLMLMTGRFDWRQGMRVILGCFIIFGAPVIAAALMGLVRY
ncbi:MAG: TrbC/VirB2 family protein [Pontixanthobacter sp.]